MKVLVAYASKYGSTKGIAEFIAEKLRMQGVEVEIQKVDSVRNPRDYGALVIGSSAYMGHWMKEASEFVMRNRDALSSRPVWLFSSGPLVNNASVNDPKLEPKETVRVASGVTRKSMSPGLEMLSIEILLCASASFAIYHKLGSDGHRTDGH